MSEAGNASVSSSEVMSVNVWLTWTFTPGAWLRQAAAPSLPVSPACRMVMTASVPALVSAGCRRVADGQVSGEVDVELDDACLHGAAPEGDSRQVGAVGQGPAAASESPGRRDAHHEVRAGAADRQQP